MWIWMEPAANDARYARIYSYSSSFGSSFEPTPFTSFSVFSMVSAPFAASFRFRLLLPTLRTYANFGLNDPTPAANKLNASKKIPRVPLYSLPTYSMIQPSFFGSGVGHGLSPAALSGACRSGDDESMDVLNLVKDTDATSADEEGWSAPAS
ncbi:hypothetical protein MSAN_00860900 [Mycena sanguinolenta]|uniref:Uncharacterized protein n=1 Tax=Mycena sanguinolenta TaxID=230812 RepID=A0A8H6YZR2_9AGAR|nr:hypothetical protein MSAN_00860900 [Mycena sanguinolenta]